VGPRAGLDYVERRKFLALPGLKLRPLGRPACSQSLYGLLYPGSLAFTSNIKKQSLLSSIRKYDKGKVPCAKQFSVRVLAQ
jgi:hypothetical protein